VARVIFLRVLVGKPNARSLRGAWYESAIVTRVRPEAGRSIPGQGEVEVLPSWRPEEVLRTCVLLTWE